MGTTRSISASRPARAFRRLFTAAALCAVAVDPAAAQWRPLSSGIVVVDMERALRETGIGKALDRLEAEARRALEAQFEQTRLALERREKELLVLRDSGPREAFEEQARAFDQHVREERRAAQEQGAALQARFAQARRVLSEAATPELRALMAGRDAVIAFERDSVLAVEPSRDVTDELIARLDAAFPAEKAGELAESTARP